MGIRFSWLQLADNGMESMIAFGPVPSRRLGRSLGINNIPPKVCTYSCAYCQLGRTIEMQIGRFAFYEPDEVLRAVRDRIGMAVGAGESVDYLSFVPDGEPTLDANLGREIELLRTLGITAVPHASRCKVAVITNGSLIWRRDVRADLMQADWVSLKVDSTREETWRSLDRPYRTLHLGLILEGMLEFADAYTGINDDAGHVGEVADYLAQLKPVTAYLSVPIRPPAEAWVRPPREETINQAYHLLRTKLEQVECLTGYEGDAFAFTGDVERDLMSITAVHPMRQEAVEELLARAGRDWSVVRGLVARDLLVETDYAGQRFYLRKLRRAKRDHPEIVG
jgi:wyosine [tRNA(Phe)-imidazoG37] synthetase (radical SAM superfamily)